MTREKLWLPVVGLALLLPGCLVAKSVGDDPDTADLSDSADSATEDPSDTATPPDSSTSGSASGTSTSSGTGAPTATSGTVSTVTTGGGDPLMQCGVEPVPPGLPGYMYSFECGTGQCSFAFVVPLPLDSDEDVAACLCEIGCGEPFGGEAEVGGGTPGPHGPDYDGVCDVEIYPNEGGGYYEQLCACETCEVSVEDVSAQTVLSPLECDCLCLEAGCGYSEGGTSGVGSDGESDSSTSGGTDGTDTAGTSSSTSG